METARDIFCRYVIRWAIIVLALAGLFPALSYGQSCTADFTALPRSGCEGFTAVYTDASSGASSWTWSFPGGTPSSADGKGPHKVVYNTAGTYDAALLIQCKQGVDSELKKGYISVTACCIAAFGATPTSGCPGLEVTYTDASTGAAYWSWNFPGGTPSAASGRGPHKVVYKTAGTFDASLNILCKSGEDSEYKTALIQISECKCVADFDADQVEGTPPLTVRFTDKSENAVNWFWSFPGGEPSSMQGQGPHTVVYNSPGEYDVSLQINCINGEDLLQREDYIHVQAVDVLGDYGDAPEGVIAYPSTGVIGAFPTCRASGSAGYIRHAGDKGSFLGNKVDHELEGNAGSCSSGSLFDQDELCYEADAGLWAPDAFTLQDSAGILRVVPLCSEFIGTALGEPCATAQWGRNINLYYYSDHVAGGAYVNVLIDWNQDGRWGGSSLCSGSATAAGEHVLKNFPVPGGTAGHLSTLDPPDFLIGPNPGYVWMRMTITETPVALPWDGSGEFDEGESEDYLLFVYSRSACVRDSLALVALYRSTNGSEWTNNSNWLTGPLSTWYGVELDGCRVHSLLLHNNNLTGTLPPAVGDLNDLIILYLNDNQLEGELPAGLYTLSNLVQLSLDDNRFSGEISPAISGLNRLWALRLYRNNFSGLLPDELAGLNQLEIFSVHENHFSHLPDLSSLPLTFLNVRSNRLTFGDIEANMGITSFTYAPQDSLGTERDTTLIAGRPFQLHVEVDGTANHYQWQRNGVDLPGRNGATLTILAVSAADTGSYICRITSSIAVDLTLHTRPVHLYLEGGTEVQVPPALIPDRYALEQNYPNPFNPETRIVYQLPRPSRVWLAIYNVQGQRIRLLVDEDQDAGVRYTVWDGRDDHGTKMSSDIYFYRLNADGFSAVKKMVLVQ